MGGSCTMSKLESGGGESGLAYGQSGDEGGTAVTIQFAKLLILIHSGAFFTIRFLGFTKMAGNVCSLELSEG